MGIENGDNYNIIRDFLDFNFIMSCLKEKRKVLNKRIYFFLKRLGIFVFRRVRL